MAAAVALLLEFRPAWRQLLALVIVSAAAGLGTYLIAQGFLGALPHQPVATWASLSLLLMAVSAATAGLIALIGAAGLGISAALMIFVGKACSGSQPSSSAITRRSGSPPARHDSAQGRPDRVR